jgi:hypothetical protein
MAAGWGKLQAYEKAFITKIAYSFAARFTGHVQFKGVRQRTTDRKGEHTRPACRGERLALHLSRPAQPHFSSIVSGLRPVFHLKTLLLSTCWADAFRRFLPWLSSPSRKDPLAASRKGASFSRGAKDDTRGACAPHGLPRGFTRVRHYGWLSPAAWAQYARVRQILRAGDVVLSLPDKAEILCPCCGHVMIFFHALRTGARPPPLPPLPPASSSAIAIPA